MIRARRTTVLLLTTPALLGLGLAAAGPADAASTAQPAAVVCPAASTPYSWPISVYGFSFNPGTVGPGDSSIAVLVTANCSMQPVQTVQRWTGQWLAPSSAAAPIGCPAIDPLDLSVDYGPGVEMIQKEPYTVPAGCTATELHVTVRIAAAAGSALPITTATATLHIVQPTS